MNNNNVKFVFLLAEFSILAANYVPSFFPSIYAREGHISIEKTQDP